MQTVLIDVGEELNRLIAVANLAPTANIDVIEAYMLQLRENSSPLNTEGAARVLDIIQALREFKSATEAYSKFIIKLAEEDFRRPSGDAST